jgi:membrane protease YdiL (CAAX protease family)
MTHPDRYRVTGSPAALAAAGILAVAVDFALYRWCDGPEVLCYLLRGAVGVVILLALILSGGSRPSDHGLALAGWSADWAWVLKLSAAVLAASVAAGALAVVLIRLGWVRFDPWELYPLLDFHDGEELRRYVLIALVWAPLVEELVYRGLAYPALAGTLGRRVAVFLSGPLFYLLHLVYRRPWFLLHYVVAGWVGAVLLVFFPEFVRWLLGSG